MKTLSQVLASVEPAGSITSIRELASLLDVGEPISLSRLLEEGTKYRRLFVTSISFLEHNVALFPGTLISFSVLGGQVGAIPLYGGKERDKVLPTLVERLRNEQPDVVGFEEFWLLDEQNELLKQLADIYPFFVQGPLEEAPRPIELEAFAGGLLLLSKHPIVESHQTIYRQCQGEDCYTNKGMLHARIAVAGHPTDYDVFLSHMQSCPPEQPWMANVGPGDCTSKLGVYQTMHLRDFIEAYSSPDRPALLMGDLNHNGLDNAVYQTLSASLESPADLWLTSGDGSSGITSDSKGSFEADSDPRPIGDPSRHKSGKRLDYFFCWPGATQPGRISPLFSETRIVQWQTSNGRDISDHYGVRTKLRCVREFEVDLAQSINAVTIWVAGLRCLRETGGPLPVVSEVAGSDEIDFRISYRSASGDANDFATGIWGDLDSGSYKDLEGYYHNPPVLFGSAPSEPKVHWGDPGDFVEIKATLEEVDKDDTTGIETSRASLGTQTLTIERAHLLQYKGRGTIPRTLPLFRCDGAEYAVTVKLIVE